ncbi:MAG TPA: YdcF family protein [Bryobacteraceae bacterium]|nr:YdcF family protein [Bryobacteraceae bacterium]
MQRLYRIVRGLLAAFGLLFMLVTFTPLDAWWIGHLDEPWNDPSGDIMIVPGAEMQSDGMIGPGTYWRTVYAVRIWRQGGWKKIVVTGRDISAAMRDFLVASGVPASAILVENAAVSTRENALFTARLLHGVPGRKVLVTSDYHDYRATGAFRKAGLEVQPRPVPDMLKAIVSPWNRWNAFLGLCGETTKILYYRARGWM